MKSPADLRVILKRHWNNSVRREAWLLGGSAAWPIALTIGRPSPSRVRSDLDSVKRHVDAWRNVPWGEVMWESFPYRATSAPVELPQRWILRRPSEWIDAIGEPSVRHEFQAMSKLVEHTNALFHSLFVRRKSLWWGKAVDEVIRAAHLAMALSPGCAEGRPLRALAIEGIDTKFFERHAPLLTTLLDARFDGEVSRIGLSNFLRAYREDDHWLLVVDLDGSLLPYQKLRLRSSELRESALPGKQLLIVENEACQFQLPALPETIAVLGAGFDLDWTQGHWLQAKRVAYWGDMDTWGLQFLARARTLIGQLDALLMSGEVYEQFSSAAVPEPVPAGRNLPVGLNSEESDLYRRILGAPQGRLEQEFLSIGLCHETIKRWGSQQSTDLHDPA